MIDLRVKSSERGAKLQYFQIFFNIFSFKNIGMGGLCPAVDANSLMMIDKKNH